MASLQASLPEGASCGETEWEGGGCIYVNAPKWEAWASTGTNSLVAEYYDFKEWDITRSSAISSLIDDLRDGLEDASEDTIHAMGWER